MVIACLFLGSGYLLTTMHNDKFDKNVAVIIDKNADEYKFTLWGDQMKGIEIGTQIQLSNAELLTMKRYQILEHT